MTKAEKWARFAEVLRKPGAKILCSPDVFDLLSVAAKEGDLPGELGVQVVRCEDLANGTVAALAVPSLTLTPVPEKGRKT